MHDTQHVAKRQTATDLREQMSNDGITGPATLISTATENIIRLNGIMLDIDCGMFQDAVASAKLRANPRRFYLEVIRPMLDREPVLAKAAVRSSGRGLHILLRLVPPLEFTSEDERQRWANIVKVIQRLLPTDPDAPGITAMTRPVGSLNSKNGRKVATLFEGEPVSAEEVDGLFKRVCEAPMKTVMTTLFGADRLSPCPICGMEGSELSAGDRTANCYGSCGKVLLSRLYDHFLTPRPTRKVK